MFKRFWHFLFAHRYEVHSSAHLKPVTLPDFFQSVEDQRMNAHGFTQIDFLCSCGAHRTIRLLGIRNLSDDREVAELRRILKL